MPTRAKLGYANPKHADYLAHTAFRDSPTHRNRLAAIVALLKNAAPADPAPSILEIGCGVGNIAIPLGSLGFSVLGTDIDVKSIEVARSQNDFQNVRFTSDSLDQLNGTRYDIVILTEVLEHVGPYRELLSHALRLLKPDGRLILTVPNGWSAAELASRPSYFIKRYEWGRKLVKGVKRFLKTKDLTTANEQTPHVNFFTLRQLKRLWNSAGLDVELRIGIFWLWPLLETFFSQRGLPDCLASRDFKLSQSLPLAVNSFWAFLLKRHENPARQ